MQVSLETRPGLEASHAWARRLTWLQDATRMAHKEGVIPLTGKWKPIASRHCQCLGPCQCGHGCVEHGLGHPRAKAQQTQARLRGLARVSLLSLLESHWAPFRVLRGLHHLYKVSWHFLNDSLFHVAEAAGRLVVVLGAQPIPSFQNIRAVAVTWPWVKIPYPQ